MGILRKTELIVLAILWSMSLTTYSIALLNSYILHPSDYFGLVGLTVVTCIAYLKPEKSLHSVLILLLFGLFNLFSFAYFINVYMTFRMSFLVTPGIQLISLVLLSIVIYRERDRVGKVYRETFGLTEEDNEQMKQRALNKFKRKFEQLTDLEIESKLQQVLVPEAVAALNEIQEDRKTQDNNTHIL